MGRWMRGKMPPELARVRDRFKSWRRTRKPKTRIPDRLWAIAVKLVPAHGLHRTASTLKLDYYSLKQRVEETADSRNSGPAFLELPPAVAVARECVMEFGDGIVVNTRVHLKGYDATEVTVVARSFRNAP